MNTGSLLSHKAVKIKLYSLLSVHCGNHGNENVMTFHETIRLIVLRYLLYQLSCFPMDGKQKLRMDKRLHCKTEGKLTGAVMKKCNSVNLHLPKIPDNLKAHVTGYKIRQNKSDLVRQVSKWKVLRGPVKLLSIHYRQKR